MTNNTIQTRPAIGALSLRRFSIIASVLTSLALAAGCNDKSPVTPKPVHYNIYATANKYFDGEKNSRIYIYDADSLSLLDSIPLPNVGDEMVISPDGRSIYQLMWRYKVDYLEYLAKIDVASRSIVWTAEIPPMMDASDGPINLLDDGRVLALEGVLFDPTTGAIARQQNYHEEEHWNMGYGPVKGTEVAAVQFDSASYDYFDRSDTLAIVVDLMTGQARGHFVPRLAPEQYPLTIGYRRLHPDGERVLLLCENSVGGFFVIGNVNTGELLMVFSQLTGSGEIAISNDGKLAAVAESPLVGLGYGYPAVHIYDIESYQHRGTIDAHQLAYVSGQARFLPGDQWLVVYSSLHPEGDTDGLQIIDVNNATIEHAIDPPFTYAIGGGFGIGPRPDPIADNVAGLQR